MNPAHPNALIDQLAELLARRIADHLATRLPAPTAGEAASPWMSVDTAAAYLDWPKQRLYKLTAAGQVPHVKHDGRLLFHRDQLDTWLHNHAQGHEPR